MKVIVTTNSVINILINALDMIKEVSEAILPQLDFNDVNDDIFLVDTFCENKTLLK